MKMSQLLEGMSWARTPGFKWMVHGSSYEMVWSFVNQNGSEDDPKLLNGPESGLHQPDGIRTPSELLMASNHIFLIE